METGSGFERLQRYNRRMHYKRTMLLPEQTLWQIASMYGGFALLLPVLWEQSRVLNATCGSATLALSEGLSQIYPAAKTVFET